MAGVRSNNSTKANPCLSADILGDWREEIIARTIDNSALLIFSTDIPTDIRLHTLMHDPQYRMSIAWQNVSYNQPPHTSFFIGHGMKIPPMPTIRIIRK
jgi:rhamnogalacturonan endolyase